MQGAAFIIKYFTCSSTFFFLIFHIHYFDVSRISIGEAVKSNLISHRRSYLILHVYASFKNVAIKIFLHNHMCPRACFKLVTIQHLYLSP